MRLPHATPQLTPAALPRRTVSAARGLKIALSARSSAREPSPAAPLQAMPPILSLTSPSPVTARANPADIPRGAGVSPTAFGTCNSIATCFKAPTDADESRGERPRPGAISANGTGTSGPIAPQLTRSRQIPPDRAPRPPAADQLFWRMCWQHVFGGRETYQRQLPCRIAGSAYPLSGQNLTALPQSPLRSRRARRSGHRRAPSPDRDTQRAAFRNQIAPACF